MGAARSGGDTGDRATDQPFRVELRLFATLRRYLPAGAAGHAFTISAGQGSTIREVIGRAGIPLPLARMVLLNGVYVHDQTARLESDCTLSIFPALAGG